MALQDVLLLCTEGYTVESFNRNFSTVGITVEKHDVAIECREELEKLKRRMEYDKISSYRWFI